jgi:PST family polysaccharide transporter
VLVARTAQAVLSLGAVVVLARLLTPNEFGVFAMVVPLGIIADSLAKTCFQTTLLQRRDLTEQDISAFFWFAARVNLLIVGGMVAVGFALARFYAEPRIGGVAAAWALLIYLLTLTSFQEGLLKRELRFPTVLLLQLAALVIGLAAAVTAAWRGAGYWSLPIQILVMDVSHAIGVFAVSSWRPQWTVDVNGQNVAEMRRSWRALVGLTLATWVNEQPDLVAVGRVGGAFVLGLYDTARRWSWYPFREPFLALTDLAVASLSRVHGDPERFRRVASRAILVMLTVSMPVIALVAVESPSVVHVLLGDKWQPAIPFLRLLCVVAFAGSLARVTQWIYLSQGNAGRLLRWSLFIQAPAVGVAVLAGLPWGPLGVTRSMAVMSSVLVLPGVAYGVRGTPLTFIDVMRVAARPALASLMAAAIVAVAGGVLPNDPGLRRLAASLSIYAAVFVIAWLGIPGGIADTRALASAFREFRPAVQLPPGDLQQGRE